MSSLTLDVNTVQLISKFTELGIKYFESRQRRKVDLAEAGIVDSVDEALREFEALDVPQAYTPHELEEGEDVIASSESEEVEGEPV